MNAEALEPKTEELIRKNKKKNEYVLDDSEINQDLITNSYP
jgi:hypothetical protein